MQVRLRFTAGGDSEAERAWRTHWVSAGLSAPRRERMTAPPDLVVVQRVKEWTCAECGVRHEDTAYDELLMSVAARDDAREQIKDTIALILRTWAYDPRRYGGMPGNPAGLAQVDN